MRNHRRVIGIDGHFDGFQRFGKRAYLVRFNENRIGDFLVYPLFENLGVGHEQVIADNLDSLTKFVGGHSDLIAGAAVGPKELLQPMRATRTFTGSQASPWTGWLLMRSLETLKLRMDRQAETAGRIAPFLVEHPKVTSVRYLGLLAPGDPQHEIYKRQCLGPGSMISFEVDGGEAGAFRFLNALRLVHLAVSLGGTESLAEHPASFTHAGVSLEHKAQLGITSGLVRMSVGVEHYSDLLYDLDQALQAV